MIPIFDRVENAFYIGVWIFFLIKNVEFLWFIRKVVPLKESCLQHSRRKLSFLAFKKKAKKEDLVSFFISEMDFFFFENFNALTKFPYTICG